MENSITLDSLVCILMSNAPRKNNYLTSFISIQECLEYKKEEKEIANFIIVWVTKFRNDFSWLANYGRVQARDKLLNWITILRNNYNICKSHVILKFIQSQRQFFFLISFDNVWKDTFKVTLSIYCKELQRRDWRDDIFSSSNLSDDIILTTVLKNLLTSEERGGISH